MPLGAIEKVGKMLSNEQLEVMSATLAPLFQRMEQELIVDVARRIKKTTSYSRTAELYAVRMKELGYSPAQVRSEAMRLLRADSEYRREVAKNTMEYKRDVRKLVNDTLNKAMHENNELLIAGGDMAWVDDLRVWKMGAGIALSDSFLPGVIEIFKQQTDLTLKNLTRTLAFKGVWGMSAVENAYQNELDFAMVQLLSGTSNREKIIQNTVHNLAKSGVRSIDYASGRSYEIDTAVRLSMRTAYHQMAGKITDKNVMQTGQALVWVSEHWGARNTGIGVQNHEDWQGQIYYVTDLPPANAMEEAERIGQSSIQNVYDATGYDPTGQMANDPLGLYGYNCRHSLYPWFSGQDKPKSTPQPAPIVVNGKEYDYYAQTQKQRAIERQIRALKRERDAAYSLHMDSDVKQINAKISAKTREYKEWCQRCGINQEPTRLRYESGTSDLKKTEAYKAFAQMQLKK